MSTTNLLAQHKEMKTKHPDAILLFRVGDFYECFKEDAQTASEILGITLTRRGTGKDAVYLSGFPHHALDTYLPKLVRAGKRIAICEQLEDPKKTVKRGGEEQEASPITEKPQTSAPQDAHSEAPVEPLKYQTLAELLELPEVTEMTKEEPEKSVVAWAKEAAEEYGVPQIKMSYRADRKRYTKTASTSKAAQDLFRAWWNPDTLTYTESMAIMCLNRMNKPLGILKVTEGSAISTVFDIQKIAAAALLTNAQAVIMAHNHPSGNLRPSPQDDQITRETKKALAIFGIKMLDHIILTDESYFSYADEGRI